MHCVLIVDDDPHIREVICFALEQAGMHALIARNGEEALHQHRTHQPDLIILDVLMPELDGIAACRQLRQISDVPILLLSSRDEEVDRILGLESGADDYIGKPFSPRELVARVQANLRRQTSNVEQIGCDGYEVDEQAFEIRWNDAQLSLTQTEFHLLKTLITMPDKVFDRDELMRKAYDVRRIVSHRTIDSHVRRLREKLTAIGAPGITTVHGVGFRLTRG